VNLWGYRMTKQEMSDIIEETMNNLKISKKLTKSQMIDKINETFERLLIKKEVKK